MKQTLSNTVGFCRVAVGSENPTHGPSVGFVGFLSRDPTTRQTDKSDPSDKQQNGEWK